MDLEEKTEIFKKYDLNKSDYSGVLDFGDKFIEGLTEFVIKPYLKNEDNVWGKEHYLESNSKYYQQKSY